MGTRNIQFFTAIVLLCTLYTSWGQGEGNLQSYWIHEDVVKPGMVAEYETICKELTDNLKKHNIQEFHAIVTYTLDNRYLWVSPVNGMADIDKPLFETLAEKMGADNLNDLSTRMDKCYEIEHNYMLELDKELSYMPGGITQTPEGEDYRKFHYYRLAPSNKSEVRQQAKAIKDLFEKKGSTLHYRVYHSGFGNRGEYYMVAIAAKDAADYEAKIAANNELLGDEWADVYGDFMGALIEYDLVEGWMRPDMAYIPQ